MKDIKGTMLSIGEQVCIQEDIPSVNGMLYKNTKVIVKERGATKTRKSNTIRVEDAVGRCYWISNADILIG